MVEKLYFHIEKDTVGWLRLLDPQYSFMCMYAHITCTYICIYIYIYPTTSDTTSPSWAFIPPWLPSTRGFTPWLWWKRTEIGPLVAISRNHSSLTIESPLDHYGITIESLFTIHQSSSLFIFMKILSQHLDSCGILHPTGASPKLGKSFRSPRHQRRTAWCRYI